ncbi:Enhancer of polycomb-like protein 1 [Paramarasmius palmivorus]|uniref:Enhancer of polycomb-like protein 1 n=1 Tax=Paramarasmius palmivorus TaxID=297713 RepID=A0AAW0BQH2_9AGAR
MPAPRHPPASTLRNRNRINNKSRLKIVHGNIDADPIIPDEDEEKNRLLQSVAGVDQEDANEHHLQQVLSEAAQRNQSSHRSTRGQEKEKKEDIPSAFIPVPEANGVVTDHEKLYPPNRWKDPAGYIFSTSTVDEAANAALANGFTYYMDERDAEWLTRNNEEARGEGTSAQGAVSPSGIRTSARSAKGKSKEPDSSQPVAMSEDEFELVMGLLEKTTHEKTEFLHHSFSELRDRDDISCVLGLSRHLFVTTTYFNIYFILITFLAPTIRPANPYSSGSIPLLERKATRERWSPNYTRTQHAMSKQLGKPAHRRLHLRINLHDYKQNLPFRSDLARSILTREELKRDSLRHSQHIWEQRMQMVELRLQNPALVEKGDDELLVDKERLRKPECLLSQIQELQHPLLRSLGRKTYAQSSKIGSNTYMAKQKENDQHWEDVVDTGYVLPPSSYGSRLFKYISPSQSDNESTRSQPPRRPVRMRYGRGGRVLMDRRVQINGLPTRRDRIADDRMDVDAEDEERDRRLAERWKFDSDDGPTYGPNGSDEQDRIMVDDFDHRYLRYTVPLLTEQEVTCLLNDPTFVRYTPDGRKEPYVPFKLGQPSRPILAQQQQMISQTGQQSVAAAAAVQVQQNPGPGMSVPVSQQMKMQPPGEAMSPQMLRISGGMRRPSVPTVPSVPSSTPSSTASSPPKQQQPIAQPVPQPTPSVNGVNRPAINLPHVDGNTSFTPLNGTNGVVANAQPQPSVETVEGHLQQQDHTVNGQVTPSHLKAQGQAAQPGYSMTVNGAHINSINPYTFLSSQSSGLSVQQRQNLLNVFAAAPSTQGCRSAASQRWSSSSPLHHAATEQHNDESQTAPWPADATDEFCSRSSRESTDAKDAEWALPRTPSANGMRNMNGQSQPHMSPPPQQQQQPQTQASPPRLPQTPVMMMQHVNSQGGY